MRVTVSGTKLAALKAALKNTKRKLERELSTAINATAKKVTLEAARQLKAEMTVSVKMIKKLIRVTSKATPGNPRAWIGLSEGYPIPLKYFRAKQLKRGVAFKVNPKVRAKSILRDAFIVEQYGGNVYKRKTKNRFPLEKQFGPKPGDFFEAAGIVAKAKALAESELEKQMDRRIRFVLLESAGGLRGKRK